MPRLWAENLPAHRALVLGRLLDAYEELHAEVGVDSVTIAEVAKRAGIARSAVYNHVPDKHGLVLAAVHRTIDQAGARLAQAVDAQTTPSDQLAVYVRETLWSHASEQGAGDDLMPMLTPEEQRQLMQMFAPMRAVLEQVIERGIQSGDFAGDVRPLADVVWSLLAGYRIPISIGQIDADQAAATATAVLLRGLGDAAVAGGAAAAGTAVGGTAVGGTTG